MSKKRSIDAMLDTSNSDNRPTKKQRLNERNHNKDNEDDDNNLIIKDKLLNSEEPIILNIGGIKYSTSLLTVLSDTNSVLHKMFDGRFSLKPSKDGSYFIDRDGEHFKYILNYLRNNKLTVPNDVDLINALIDESQYYQLSTLSAKLLLKKSGSRILKEGDIEFIQKCFNEEYPKYHNINLQKHSLLHEGHIFPDYDKIKGMDCLLFLILSEHSRFGFYIDDRYLTDAVNEGFLFDLDSNISGQRCMHKKYKLNTPPFYFEEGNREISIIVMGDPDNDDPKYLDLRITQRSAGDDNDQYTVFKCKWELTEDNEIVCFEEIRKIEVFRIG